MGSDTPAPVSFGGGDHAECRAHTEPLTVWTRRGTSRATAAPSWNRWGLRKGDPLPHPHLDAVVGGVGGADQVLVGPAIQV